MVRVAVPARSCTQEEADTRMLFHAHHAAQNGYVSVCLRSPDTDVAVIGVSLAIKIQAKLIFRTGTQHCSHFIDLSAIADKQGNIAPV